MSTFDGIIREIPGISVDRFDEVNLCSSAFFLSHAHTDHEQGLHSIFFHALDCTKKYLYCTPVTKLILVNKYDMINPDCIREIDINANRIIEYELDGKVHAISVTCITAGHSLGSAMFLFEKNEVSILYTGDFRIQPSDLSKIKCLHNSDGVKRIPKKFTKIYLDTTFLTDFPQLPTRQESLSKICSVSKEWFDQDPDNIVSLECSHNYGSEFLYVGLSKFFNRKVHVKDRMYKTYCHIVELMPHVTSDTHSTNIHACKDKRKSLNCRYNIPYSKVLTIIPSVLKWKGKDTSIVGEWDQHEKRTYNVCYSTHSSFNEIEAFINYFDCLDIHPCVYESTVHREAVISLLNQIKQKSVANLQVDNVECASSTLNFKHKTVFRSAYFDGDEDSS